MKCNVRLLDKPVYMVVRYRSANGEVRLHFAGRKLWIYCCRPVAGQELGTYRLRRF